MASSRKPAPRSDSSDRLTDKVAQALQASAAFVVSGGTGASATDMVVAVALSGGRDSVALLHATQATVSAWRMPARVVALHVHHGLQAQADEWGAFCTDLCARWELGYFVRRVSVQAGTGEGIEAAARRARYEALGDMCRASGARFLLFAHHLDDQVETVLLRLFRGAGVAGMSGMPAMRKLDGAGDIMLLRPWLEVPRADIDSYCAAHELAWIDDPSNDSTRYARNALRGQLPLLERDFPALRANVAQAAAHFAQAARMLDDLAGSELARLVAPGRDPDTLAELDLSGLRALPASHADAVLRLWLRELGARAPSTARLAAMREQLLDHIGGEPAIAHDNLVLRRFQGRVLACAPEPDAPPTAQALTWRGEPRIVVPAWRGELRFTRDDTFGVPEAVLQQPLRIAQRTGGERIVLRPGGPARALKQAYQEAGVPRWRRCWLPLLWAGDTLVMAAGLGMHRRWTEAPHAPRWRVEWIQAAADARLE
ncbi:tRNA lysidine(34) synthetase TilS [Cupriavidus pinatubonensis]|uniref:tRNA(Ile)-lysidine synthase n=1 Tax=Cupriavidus pinatubonensis TaxID=248026 RepID=A0ABN7ZDW4_9BURK|nr:tRNA lysidine(34) synthetase TilS [Cupriavidus pinatubonensis]CAG9184149.1 tRNA(Ile)-lysidine synthase [Cupriavidus pinatubonensis]